MHRINEREMSSVKKQASAETKYKIEAMTKLEGLRQEMQNQNGGDAPTQST